MSLLSVPDLIEALISAEPAAAAQQERVRVVRAPGRVNLIGEYTDINDGHVLPAAIDLEIRMAYLPTTGRQVRLTRLDENAQGSFELGVERERSRDWLDYVAGTAWALDEAGHELNGLCAVITADLPPNAGLSSSAAIELASAWALLGDAADGMDQMELARICQHAENAYVGVKSGLMDQFASSCGVAGAALILDCRSLEWRPVSLPAGLELVVCHTGAPRNLDGSAYNERREQCEAAVAVLAADDPTITALRDVSLEQLDEAGDRLDPVVRRRALHVVTEEARVAQTVAAIEADDRTEIGRLFAASHASLRDQFEVSSPALDAMVEVARSVPGVVAARMTGAGFGGCTVNLVEPGTLTALRTAVERDYATRTGLRPMVLPVKPAVGAGRLD